MTGQLNLAERAYRQALAIRPRSADILTRLGDVHAGAGNFAGAEDAYKQALDADSPPWDLEYKLAVVAARQGRSDEALSRLESALKKGFNSSLLVQETEAFDSLRTLPRYLRLIKTLQGSPQ
jgi:tetratricopeptide (TPR) repeat protein